MEELDHCREALLQKMTLDYQVYIKNYYVLLEEHLVICYI